MPVLDVRSLTKVYGDGDTAVRALDGVSLQVERGEYVAVMGCSGSGRSTLSHRTFLRRAAGGPRRAAATDRCPALRVRNE
jgi:ABC-type lipoprotein export system ATPase subunit